ncbi:MAG: NAD(P)/FAD-dependent oxidoreductase [Thermodesulfobacteriota bacterium]
MVKIVVLGGSFGGLTAALELKRLLGRQAEVTVVSAEERFVFLPSLPWLIMGWRKPGDITMKVADILQPRGISFIQAAALEVLPESRRVRTGLGELSYDYLVVSTGPQLAFAEIPGLGPDQGHTDCTFTIDHAVRTGRNWQAILDNPGPVVVGSAQMVSCFGPSYELAFEMDAELRRRRMRHKVPILYLTSEPYLGHMGVGGLGNSRRFMEDEFAAKDIKPIVSQAIDEVAPGEIRLKDGTKIPFKLAMLAPPFKGVPAVAPLGNPRGFVPVDHHYRHTKHPNIFVIGVAMAIAPPEPTPVPVGVPKTGSMTVRMAKVAAATIAAEIHGAPLPNPEELAVICLMDMGDSAALMKAWPLLPPRQESYTRKGVWAKWLKLSFERYFLFKMKHGYSQLP